MLNIYNVEFITKSQVHVEEACMALILMKVGTSLEEFELVRCNMNTLNTELSLF